jgi:hypothetical protein
VVNAAAVYDLGHGVTTFARIDNMLELRVAFDTGLGGR